MIKFGIIAAGEGSRINSEGAKESKPLLKVNGTPMIGRLIKLIEDSVLSLNKKNLSGNTADVLSISVILNRDMEDVENYLQYLLPEIKYDLKIISTKTPSSMHSFSRLIELMNPEDKFVITTVDTIFRQEEFIKYVNSFENVSDEVDGLMGVTTHIDDENPLYVETSENLKITAFPENANPGIKYISAGVYGLRKNSIPILQECMDKGIERMRNFQRSLVNEGLNLRAYDLGIVFDIDHLSDLEKANKFLSENRNRKD